MKRTDGIVSRKNVIGDPTNHLTYMIWESFFYHLYNDND